MPVMLIHQVNFEENDNITHKGPFDAPVANQNNQIFGRIQQQVAQADKKYRNNLKLAAKDPVS